MTTQTSKNIFLFCLLLLMSAAFTFKAPVKLENALLWEISGKGLTKPSYLYGTIHAICPADMVISDGLKAKLKSTEQLSLEIDMDDPDMMREMMQGIAMKDGSTLKTLYSEADYNKVSQYFTQTLGMDVQMVATWKPLMLSSLLLTKMADCAPQSYEATFMKMTLEQGKEVVGVESISDQLALFDKIPYKQQAEILLTSINEMPQNKQTFKQMVALYKEQNLDGFQKLFRESSEELENFGDILLVQRNKNWIPVIEREAKEKSTFFAVGAGHLGGDNGVIQLLRQAGYTVKPVL